MAVSSAKFICCCWRNPWCNCHHTHTHRNVKKQPKYGQIINCGLTILTVSLFSLCHLRITTQLRSGVIDKMAGIFTKRIEQTYICQPNKFKREIKKKTGGAKRGAKQKSGETWPTQAPLRIATAHRSVECVLLHSLNAPPYIFAVVNCSDVALSMLYTPVSTRWQIAMNCSVLALSTVFSSGLLTWSVN